jgi:hypothetical protein
MPVGIFSFKRDCASAEKPVTGNAFLEEGR